MLITTAIETVQERIISLKESQIEKMTVKGNVALICCVGDNMIDTFGVAAKVFGTVAQSGANVEMI